jgi:ribosomal protein S18 acetylase RimI-like enzyme
MSSNLPSIGPVARSEIDALTVLMHDTIKQLDIYNERARRSELAKYTLQSLAALAAADPHAIIVARDADGLAGFCISRFDDGTIWLSWFGTAARARGRGFGAALLAALAGTLPARDAHKIWCDSRTENEKSKSVLERAGYRRITTLVNHWYGQDYYLWEYYP